MIQDLKVGNTNSVSVVKYSMLHIFMASYLASSCLPISNFIDCSQSWNI